MRTGLGMHDGIAARGEMKTSREAWSMKLVLERATTRLGMHCSVPGTKRKQLGRALERILSSPHVHGLVVARIGSSVPFCFRRTTLLKPASIILPSLHEQFQTHHSRVSHGSRVPINLVAARARVFEIRW